MRDFDAPSVLEAPPRAPHAPGRDASPSPATGPAGGRLRWIGLGALALLLAALGLGVLQHYRQHRDAVTVAERQVNFVPSLRVAAVRASADTLVVTLPATTKAWAAATVFARASGYISARHVDIGSRVKAGQLLAEITAPELDHQIAQAQGTLLQNEAALRQTEANRELARVTMQRNAGLVAQNFISKLQGDQDRLNYQAQDQAAAAAQATIDAQSAQVKVLQQQKLYQQVVAPFAGVITRRNIDAGDLVQADAASGTAMFAIVQSDVMRIQVYVPQEAAFGVAPGIDAVVRVPEIPGRTFPGKVTMTADALQPNTRTLLTEIDLPNPDGALLPEVYCTVELHVPRKTPSLIVPAEAIIFNRNGMQVAVVENGIVHIRKIDVARDLGTEVEVRDGLANGEQVVLNPPVNLAEGSKVEIQAPPSAATTKAR
jgi:RND family efflux transporter MFP subunit